MIAPLQTEQSPADMRSKTRLLIQILFQYFPAPVPGSCYNKIGQVQALITSKKTCERSILLLEKQNLFNISEMY